MVVKKRSGLGRGLSELLSTAEITTPDPMAGTEGSVNKEKLKQIPIEWIKAGRYQPRKAFDHEALQELAESIRHQGIIQPIVLRPLAENQYEIIAGERRWRAAQIAGIAEVPAVIRDVSDQAALAVALIENIQREQLNPIEEARAIQRLINEFDLTHQEAADALGKNRVSVSNLLRVLNLDTDVLRLVENGDLEMGHAKVLLGLVDKNQQLQAAHCIVERHLTVRDTENYLRQRLEGAQKPTAAAAKAKSDPDISRLQKSLSESLGALVAIEHHPKGKGKIVIQYHSLEQLEGILDHLR